MRHFVAVRCANARRWALGLASMGGLATAGCNMTTDEDVQVTARSATAAAVINLGKTLRVGWMGMDHHVGEGPGGDTGTPIYKVVQWSPHAEGLANVPAVIALADQKDILLLAYTPGAPGNYGLGTPTGFDINAYKAQLNKLKAIPAFNDAVARGRIQCYIGDEPNLPAWNNSDSQSTFTPTMVNRAAQENKIRWPGCLTYIRATPELLSNGWGGNGKPVGGYTHLDYGWLQYNAGNRKLGLTIRQAISTQKGFANPLDIGLALSMNMANAGLRTDLDGVRACWDSDQKPATAIGVVIGVPATGTFTEGQRVPCSQLPPTTQNLIVNPDWIRQIATVAKTDLKIPFLLYWNYPDAAAGSGVLANYVFRSDFVPAFNNAINQGATRTAFDGYRTPKP